MKNRTGRMGRKLDSLLGLASRRGRLHRALRAESLESRQVMAGDDYLPYHNDLIPADTNYDYAVSAVDALLVINAINSGRLGALPTSGIGKADGPMIDVSGDNNLSALDALRVINSINAEGADAPIVGFSYQLTDISGNPLTNNQASVGQTVQLRASVRDLRGFDAKGVFAAFLDLDYNNAAKFQVQVGETQSFRYFYDSISLDTADSSFKFTFGNQTTAPVSLFNSNSPDDPRSAEQMAVAIQAALELLPNIGKGNVSVRVDPVSTAEDQAAKPPVPRNSFDIGFINAKAGQDVPLLLLDASGVKVQSGKTFNFTLADKYPADASNPNSYASAFVFTDEFTVGRTATNTAGVFDEVGAAQGLGAQTSPGLVHALFSVTLKALEAGTVTFTPNKADVLPSHDVLVRPNLVVPPDLVNYGNPFTLTIVNELTANPDSYTLAEDAASAAYDVTLNDQLFVGTSFTITNVTASQAGVIPTISSDGKKINYKPVANFFGTDTFNYTITNNNGVSSTTSVTMNITAVNDPISVPNQVASTNLGKSITLTAAQLTVGGSVGPDNEVPLQQLSIAGVVGSTSTRGGAVAFNNGSIVYTPPVGFPTSPNPNTDTFRFVVTDNGLTNGQPDPKNQTVTATVTVTNDQPSAVADNYPAVIEEAAFVMSVLDNDSAGAGDIDSLIISAAGPASQGTVAISQDKKSITYTPKTGFLGQDTFNYTVRDLGGLQSTATVTVNVIPARLPSALPDAATVAEDSAAGVEINVLANDRVSAGATKQIDSIQQPVVGGTVSQQNGNLLFVPSLNFFGTATFSYTMNQSPASADGPSTTSVVVTVTPVNDAPVLGDDQASGTEDQPVTIPISTLLANDNPGSGEAATQNLTVTGVQAVSPPNAGVVAIVGNNVVYTPAPDFNGLFVFKYTARDNGTPALSSEAFVSVTLASVNDKPIANPDPASGSEAATTTPEDTPKTILASLLLQNDKAGPATALDEVNQMLSVVSVSATSAKGGTVKLSDDKQSIIYTPAAFFFGTDTFTYVLQDDGTPAESASGVVSVFVTAVNNTPIVNDDSLIAFKDAPLVIAPNTLFLNDAPGPANESFQTLTITRVFDAKNGTVLVNTDGQVVFTPDAGYLGDAEFYYTAEDNGQTNGTDDFKSATGKVSIEVKDFQPSDISGTVYVDENNNGLIDANERRLGAVEVVLSGKALGQEIVPMSYTTGADGHYHFRNLAPGSYMVSFNNPTLMLDGKDTAGVLGDADGQVNNNAFGVEITTPGGFDANNYNFGVMGYQSGFGSIIERLASRYYAAGSNLSTYGLYTTLNSNGSMSSFAKLDGFNNVVFAEAVLINNGTELVLTIVESDHSVYSALLGRGKFLSMFDSAGNSVIRVLGGREQLKFVQIDLAAPPVVNSPRYLDEVDAYFAQQGW